MAGSDEKKQEQRKALRSIVGELVSSLMTEKAEQMSLRHAAIEAMTDSWGLSTPEAITLLMETVIGIACLNKKDESSYEAVIEALEISWRQRIDAAKKGVGEFAAIKDKLKKAREQAQHRPVKEPVVPVEQRTILKGKVIKRGVCECGADILKPEIPIGKEYRILSDTIRETTGKCQACNKDLTVSVGSVIEFCDSCQEDHETGIMAIGCLSFSEGAS